ncbi:hypothetical protein IG193_01710 [Infirmifilum lucidum]|uniref:MFS transporter n=2 Tax=Infirmifilum lucidum TaxID=2776706 RepID=A0A7L9FJU8_9CREN|nr:MFS transporter [Infirmifilum lucidum]QOJ79204.1 hypothetical protein IG193_01710 [Infirmifilum lucidum]
MPVLVLYAYNTSLSEFQISVITGFASLVYIVGALFSSNIHLRTGNPRAVIAASFAVMAMGFAALPFSYDFAGILESTSLVLLGFGVFWPAVEAYLSRKESSVSKFSFSWSSGSLIGALLTSTLLRLNPQILFAAYSLLSVLQALQGLKMSSASSRRAGTDLGSPGSVKDLLLYWTPWAYCIAYSASASGVLTFYPLFVADKNISRDYISLVNFTMLLSRTLTFFLFERLPAHLKNTLLASLGFAAGLALTSTTSVPVVVLIAGVIGYGQGVVYARALQLVFNKSGSTEKMTSLFESFIGLGYAVAPPLSSLANMAVGFEPIAFASTLALIFSLFPSLNSNLEEKVAGQ